jgi:hypothetical protein
LTAKNPFDNSTQTLSTREPQCLTTAFALWPLAGRPLAAAFADAAAAAAAWALAVAAAAWALAAAGSFPAAAAESLLHLLLPLLLLLLLLLLLPERASVPRNGATREMSLLMGPR